MIINHSKLFSLTEKYEKTNDWMLSNNYIINKVMCNDDNYSGVIKKTEILEDGDVDDARNRYKFFKL